MTIDWINAELYFKRSVGETNAGDTRQRGWLIAGYTPDAAKIDPGAPKRGDPHPDDPSLVVSSILFAPSGVGASVTAQYVASQYSGGPPPENTTELAYASIDTTFEDVDIEIPVYKIDLVRNIFGSGGVLSEIPVYTPLDAGKATFRYSRVVHRVLVNATVSSGPSVATQLSIAQTIHGQTNKIHKINGVDYLFKCDSISRNAIDAYSFTYRWTYDPGVANTLAGSFDETVPGSSGSTPDAYMGRIGAYSFPMANADFVVEPYSRLDVAPAQIQGNDAPSAPPVIKSVPSFVEDLTGWQSLPGAI